MALKNRDRLLKKVISISRCPESIRDSPCNELLAFCKQFQYKKQLLFCKQSFYFLCQLPHVSSKIQNQAGMKQLAEG